MLIRQYANPTELTADLLNALIEKIVVHEAVKNPDGTRDQEIEIYYRFIGRVDRPRPKVIRIFNCVRPGSASWTQPC